jgi:hypothetical protein
MVNELAHWVISIFVVLFGLGIIYTIARIIIIFVSPDTDNKITLYFILRDVKKYFGFLLKKGYTVTNLKYVSHHYGGWHFQLDSPNNKLSIIFDEQNSTLLIFRNEETRFEISLGAMIYYLTKKNAFPANSFNNAFASRRKQFQKTAKLINAYINQIENHLNGDLKKMKVEVSVTQEQYEKLSKVEFEKWFIRKKN